MKLRAAVVLVATVAVTAAALETDQFAAWGRPLEDAAPLVNGWLTSQLEDVLTEANAQGSPIRDHGWIEGHYERRLRYAFIFHPLEVWTDTSGLISRYPDGWDEEDDFWTRSIYRDHSFFDVSLWMPVGPTVEVGGVRIGTDKLAHFVSVGWQAYVRYRRLVAGGMSHERAEERVIRWAVFGEKDLLLGYRTSGVLSTSDLEADYRGMLFYRDLCGGPDPVLERTNSGWRMRRSVDIRRYVTPEWDESYQPQLFRPGRWKRIRPVLEGYCRRLHDPWVQNLRARYRERDTLTPVERVLTRLVKQGKLKDPREQSLEAVCGEPLRPWSFVTQAARPPSLDDVPPDQLEGTIREEQVGRPIRGFRLWRVGWYRPLGGAVSLGWLRAPFAAEEHCTGLCELRGTFFQATAGAGGGALAVGRTQLLGSLRRNDRTLKEASLAWGVKATLLRTWGDPVGRSGGETFAGPGFEFSIARVNLEIQLLRRISGSGPDEWLAVWGFGMGF